ncbi:MAG: TrmB family transcriptional regulator [Halobacteriota archaeon]
MVTYDELTFDLIEFGLNEKEAQIYVHLLKYGPTAPSPLAKSLKTYRMTVHRTLTSLIEKGLVRPTLDLPTTYVAVDLDTVIDVSVKNLESDLREIKSKRQTLPEKRPFRASDEIGTFKILKNIRQIVRAVLPILASLEQEFLWVSPTEGLQVASMFGIHDVIRELSERGGTTRGITDITYSAIPFVQEALDVGEDVRHAEGYRGMFYGVFDRKHCISAINIDIKHVRLNEGATMLYAGDPVYGAYLASAFETLWKQSTSAEEQLRKLVEQGPPIL